MHSRRALLYMPGDDWKKITKAITLGVDCICMDMEDGVAANRKAEARAVESKSGMVVSITKEGRIFVDETGMTFSQFRSSFKSMVGNKAKDGVYIRGDGQAYYDLVLKVIGVVQRAGVTSISLMAEPEEPPA